MTSLPPIAFRVALANVYLLAFKIRNVERRAFVPLVLWFLWKFQILKVLLPTLKQCNQTLDSALSPYNDKMTRYII